MVPVKLLIPGFLISGYEVRLIEIVIMFYA